MTTVGTKYQMVIEREARERLGIQPGWEAVQVVVGDRLEVRFLPPEHTHSLAGRLRRYARKAASSYAAEKRAAWWACCGSETFKCSASTRPSRPPPC